MRPALLLLGALYIADHVNGGVVVGFATDNGLTPRSSDEQIYYEWDELENTRPLSRADVAANLREAGQGAAV